MYPIDPPQLRAQLLLSVLIANYGEAKMSNVVRSTFC
jgi:hypothetical protein